ncbi:MAG: hypothetical protein MR793_02970 [Bacteroidales bacterium]|nr:hypothetical protein [Bacteroidales bacterium]MDY5781570.1 hypothetical protein [Candidatus Cryptobacteroides sp.]
MTQRKEIPELQYLLELVEKQYGRKLSTTTDFESLSVIIEKATGDLLSSSTLKRLYGYVSLNTVPRKTTLDILSRFIGNRDYETFRISLSNDPQFSSRFFSAKTVTTSELKAGDRLRIGWPANRIVTLNYLGNDLFEVETSVNASLVKGDRFRQVSFMKGYPLYLSRILRNGDYTPAYVAGMNSGLNLLEVVNG